MRLTRYLINILIWLDQGFNTILFLGSPDETLSSRVGRNTSLVGWKGSLCRFAEKVIDLLFGKGHCKNKVESKDNQKDEL